MATNLFSTVLFFNLGGGEIFMIMVVILLLFGAKKIPEFARGLGKGIRQFKDATGDIQRDMEGSFQDTKKDLDEARKNIEGNENNGGKKK